MSRKYIFGRISQNRAKALKYILTETVLLLMLIVMQTTVFARLRILGVTPDLCFAALILLSYFCGREVGAVTGIALGFAVDAIGSVGISILPILYLFCGYVCGYFTKAIYPKGFLPFLTVLSAAIPAHAVITLIYICIQYSTIHLPRLLMQMILPEALVTFLAALLMFYPIKWISKFLNR